MQRVAREKLGVLSVMGVSASQWAVWASPRRTHGRGEFSWKWRWSGFWGVLRRGGPSSGAAAPPSPGRREHVLRGCGVYGGADPHLALPRHLLPGGEGRQMLRRPPCV